MTPETSRPAKPRVAKATAPEPAAAPNAEGSVEALKRRLLRLALDVHDGPMQNLAVIGFSLGDMRRRMQTLVPEEHHGKIDSGMAQIGEELVRVESELRALISALEHGAIRSIPLLDAIEMEVRSFEKRSDVKVDLAFDGNARAETDSQRIALQSVTRAALANIAKHSGATRVAVRLTGTANRVTLEIEDNGRGFDPTVPAPGRFGLSGMRERVELLGGEFGITSRPGGPTRIVASLEMWRPPADE